MAGWRVGVLLGKAEWIKDVLTFRSNMDSGMFYPIQAAAATALGLGEEWFTQLNEIYYAREKQAYALLDALGCKYRPGQAGLFVWAELPEDYEGDSFRARFSAAKASATSASRSAVLPNCSKRQRTRSRNVFIKPSAELNLFGLCRGGKTTVEKRTFS